ncbi:MAG: AAA family ATPase [Candidatus Micrarchaeota archaeon]
MENAIVERIVLRSESLKKWVNQFTYERYLFNELVKTNKDFYIGIRGLRGVGKTTMLLQLSLEHNDSAYFSADWSYLKPYSIYEIANELRKRDLKTIFIDEIHTRADWSQEIKTLYDEHELNVFFSGSSSLSIKEECADLSRRAVLHELKPTSLREYLNIKKRFNIPVYSFDEIISNGKEISLRHISAYEYFGSYMREGGVLYSGEGFNEAMDNAIQKIITVDLSALRDINIKYETDAYRLLYHIAASNPFELSYSSISHKLGISKTFAIRLVKDIVATGLLKEVFPCKGGNKDVKKEPKIYFSIPFRAFFAPDENKGSVREEFFVNHVPVSCYFKTERGEKTPDFLVNGKKIEIGGVSKTTTQKPDYIAVDSALWEEKKIPLFLFGFLY